MHRHAKPRGLQRVWPSPTPCSSVSHPSSLFSPLLAVPYDAVAVDHGSQNHRPSYSALSPLRSLPIRARVAGAAAPPRPLHRRDPEDRAAASPSAAFRTSLADRSRRACASFSAPATRRPSARPTTSSFLRSPRRRSELRRFTRTKHRRVTWVFLRWNLR
uniref:Uncharacterized protein n=1 Tax=Arundo donax TaxID=35708 RepID=A0A0A9G6R5_ARUDO